MELINSAVISSFHSSEIEMNYASDINVLDLDTVEHILPNSHVQNINRRYKQSI